MLIIGLSCNNSIYNPINEVIDPSLNKGDLNLVVVPITSNSFLPQIGVSHSPWKNINFNSNIFFGPILNSYSLGAGVYSNALLKNGNDFSSKVYFNFGYSLGKYNYTEPENPDFDPISDLRVNVPGEYRGNYSKYYSQLGICLFKDKFEFKLLSRIDLFDWNKWNFVANSSYSVNIYPTVIDRLVENNSPIGRRNDPQFFYEMSSVLTYNIKKLKINTFFNRSLEKRNYFNKLNKTFNFGLAFSYNLNN